MRAGWVGGHWRPRARVKASQAAWLGAVTSTFRRLFTVRAPAPFEDFLLYKHQHLSKVSNRMSTSSFQRFSTVWAPKPFTVFAWATAPFKDFYWMSTSAFQIFSTIWAPAPFEDFLLYEHQHLLKILLYEQQHLSKIFYCMSNSTFRRISTVWATAPFKHFLL